MSSYQIYTSNLYLSALLYLYAILMFYIDRHIVQLREKDRVDNVQLYMRYPANRNPLYQLNSYDRV